MRLLILIGGLVVVCLVAAGVYFLVTRITVSAPNGASKRKQLK